MAAMPEPMLHREWPEWYIALIRRYMPSAIFAIWIASETPESPSRTNAVAIALRGGFPISTEHLH